MSDDASPDELGRILGELGTQALRQKAEDLAVFAGAFAGAGYGAALLLSSKKDENGNCALVAVLAGGIPDDLAEGFSNHVQGLHQDLFHESKAKGPIQEIINIKNPPPPPATD